MSASTDKASSTCTTCPYCGVGCGVKVTVKDNDYQVAGDDNHPANYGRLCSKGYALAETLGYENRLLSPKIDNVDVAWPEAIDRIAREFQNVRNEFGPEAIGFYVSGQLLTEDYYVVNKFVKGYLGTANIDTNSRLCMASSVAGYKRAFGSDTVPCNYEDLEAADLIVLVGSNLAWCHPVLFQRIEQIRRTRKNLQLIVVDPRKTTTAQLANLHLDIDPGDENDAILFSGLLSHLVKNDSVDYQWIDQNTNNFDGAYEAVLGWNTNLVSQHTGIAIEKISKFYREFERTKKVVTVYSQGVNQSVRGTDTVNSIINCHLATGRIGKSGCGPFSITGQPNAMGGREVGGLANMLACHMDIENPQHQSIVQRYWQSPAIAQKTGLKAVDLFDAVKSGKIKALWVMATNPADSMPAANEVAQAIADCPFVVVSDIAANTDTSLRATIQLPAQAWSEKDGTVTNSERRVSRQRKFRQAPAQARPDWWAIAEVAKKMGYKEGFDYAHPNEIFNEYAGLSAFENDGTRDFDIGAYASTSKEEYDTLAPFQWPQPNQATIKGPSRLFSDGKFFTADKKARFIEIKSRTHTESNSVVTSLSVQHQLTLNTGRIRDQWHTMTRTGYIPNLSAHMGEPFIEIHPDDAKKLGVQDEALAVVSSDYGEITVRAIFSTSVQRGSVFIPMHWTNEFSSNARVNVLMQPRTDPVSGQPSLKNQMVNVAPSKVTTYGFMLTSEKPNCLVRFDYWAIAPVKDGWKMEFASTKSAAQVNEIVRTQTHVGVTNAQMVSCDDVVKSKYSTGWFSGSDLVQSVYISEGPVWIPRQNITSYLGDRIDSVAKRLSVVSGLGYPDRPDPGSIVCSCMNVGRNTIISAIAAGSGTVDVVGDTCGAGSQCGSCRAEIAKLLHSFESKRLAV